MCAALARGESEIIHPLHSEDTEAAGNVLTEIGVRISSDEERWQVWGNNFREPARDLFCADSAATLRFMTAIAALVPGTCRLTAGPSLARRPVGVLVEALQRLGVDCSAQGELAPVTVHGGDFQGGTTELAGDISSQFVSALLFIAPMAKEGMTIRLTTPPESKPYLLMTLECLDQFGIKIATSPDLREFRASPQAYQPAKYRVEGDWSSASYLVALGVLFGEVTVLNLKVDSPQGDKMILDFLKEMGAQVKIDKNAIIVRKSRLKAIRADLSDCIDLLPTLAVMAVMAEGVSELDGIERARIKESNRVSAVREGLERMGIGIREEKDRLTIRGGRPQGAVIDSKNDHRIAMAFTLLGLKAGDTVIEQAECVAKTFPRFWEVIRSLGGKVSLS
jgi:3-phosphoshikimate 1-carboxyvinyltransferase